MEASRRRLYTLRAMRRSRVLAISIEAIIGRRLCRRNSAIISADTLAYLAYQWLCAETMARTARRYALAQHERARIGKIGDSDRRLSGGDR